MRIIHRKKKCSTQIIEDIKQKINLENTQKNIEVKEIYRGSEDSEDLCNSNDITIYDSCLRNIIVNFDPISRYITEQYIKNKRNTKSEKIIKEINEDVKKYYKSKARFLKVKRCFRCYKYAIVKEFNYGHHIIPIEYGGDDCDFNKVFLCGKCHDYVELETIKLIELGKDLSIEKLKTYIKTDFPIYEQNEQL